MAYNPDQESAPDSNPRPERRPRSTWIVIGILALLLGVFAFQGAIGIAVWFVLAGLILLLTALYALIFHRRTWVSLLTGKQRKIALAGSALMIVLGGVGVGIAAPPGQQPTADNEPNRPSDSPSPSPSPSSRTSSPTPTGTTTPPEPSIANQPCTEAEQARSQRDVEYRCTLNDDGQLVWLDKESSDKVTEARKAAEQKAAEERAAAEKAAAEEQKRAEQQAAEERAAAEKAAAEEEQKRAEQERRAAQEEADRLAAEQAAEAERQRLAEAEVQRQAEEERRLAEEQATQQPVPPNNVYYENCDAVRAAGAAPIYPEDPGWQPKFDGDKDGVGCDE